MIFEAIHPNPGHVKLRLAIFDFDGTVSLLRTGWQEIMIGMMADFIPRLEGQVDGEAARISKELVHRTNGQPTLFQMQALASIVRERGGNALEPSSYKQLFLERLGDRVRPRLGAINAHAADPETWRMPGVKDILVEINSRGIQCHLASGTDASAVRTEIAALGLASYFETINGATSDADGSSKSALFARLVRQFDIKPKEMVTFGDGAEEIRLGKELEGITIGIARDDMNPDSIDPDQRTRLITAGADVIINDFGENGRLIDYLFKNLN